MTDALFFGMRNSDQIVQLSTPVGDINSCLGDMENQQQLQHPAGLNPRPIPPNVAEHKCNIFTFFLRPEHARHLK